MLAYFKLSKRFLILSLPVQIVPRFFRTIYDKSESKSFGGNEVPRRSSGLRPISSSCGKGASPYRARLPLREARAHVSLGLARWQAGKLHSFQPLF